MLGLGLSAFLLAHLHGAGWLLLPALLPLCTAAPGPHAKGLRAVVRLDARVIQIRAIAAGTGVGRLGGNEKNVARTAYDYDYGASDTYEAYPQEDAVTLYENSAPALGARSAAEKAGDSALKSAAAAERSGSADASQPKERWVATPRAESSAMPPPMAPTTDLVAGTARSGPAPMVRVRSASAST